MSTKNKSIILSVVVMVSLAAFHINIIAAGVAAIVVGIIYSAFANVGAYKDRGEILQTECDPELFLERTKTLQKEGGMAKLADYLKIDEAVAHMAAGRFEEAKALLLAVDPEKLPNKYHVSLIHQMNLMYVYYEMGEWELAEKLYLDVQPLLSVDEPEVILTRDILLAERAYFTGELEEAKTLITALLERELKKRTRLTLIYRLAQIAASEGDTDLAKTYYQEVATSGNKLYIAEIARQKIA